MRMIFKAFGGNPLRAEREVQEWMDANVNCDPPKATIREDSLRVVANESCMVVAFFAMERDPVT